MNDRLHIAFLCTGKPTVYPRDTVRRLAGIYVAVVRDLDGVG